MAVGSLRKMSHGDKQTSLMTALAILMVADTSKRRHGTGDRQRFAYYVLMLGQVCVTAFCALYEISTPTLTV